MLQTPEDPEAQWSVSQLWVLLGRSLWWARGFMVGFLVISWRILLLFGHMSYSLPSSHSTERPLTSTFWGVGLDLWGPSGRGCPQGQAWTTNTTGGIGWFPWAFTATVFLLATRGKGAKTMDTLSWTSLLSSAPSKLSVLLIWMCYSHLAKSQGYAPTWPCFWKRLTKSFVALFEGVWPQVGMNGAPDPKGGQPLAGGFCAILYVVRGDLEWMSKHFGLNHPSSRHPCSLCGCSNIGEEDEPYPWTDINDPPSWLPTCRTDQACCWVGPWTPMFLSHVLFMGQTNLVKTFLGSCKLHFENPQSCLPNIGVHAF